MSISLAMQRSLAVAGALLLVGTALLSFAVLPARQCLIAAQAELARLEGHLVNMERTLASGERQRALTAAATAMRKELSDAGVIEPLLASFAMRGRELLDRAAQESGFNIANVREERQLPLPAPMPPPVQLHCRQLIEFSGSGSFDQIIAFIAAAERDNPLATLAGLRIDAQRATPEQHKAAIVFEWPVKQSEAQP